MLSHCFCFLSFTVLQGSLEEVTALYQHCGSRKKTTFFFKINHSFLLGAEKNSSALTHLVQHKKKKPHSLILACLGWKNAALLEVRRSNGHLINLSCLSLLTTILPVTPFNSLMTLLSVRLRRTESRYDLIKRVHMFKTVPTEMQKHWGSW